MNKTVGICVPIYNAVGYIERCIESILKQSYHNIKIFLLDDGSSDTSYNVCEQYARKDCRIILEKQENMGSCHARQKLVNMVKKYADVEFIAFVDADDFIHSDYVARLVEVQGGTGVAWVENKYIPYKKLAYFQEEKVDHLSIVKYNARELLSDHSRFVQYNMLWRKLFPIRLFDNINFPIEFNMKYFEDGATTFKLIYEAKEVRYVPEELYFTVGKRDSMTRSTVTEKRLEDSIISSESPVLFYKEKRDYYLEKCAYVQYLQTIIAGLDTCYNDSTALIDRNKCRKIFIKKFRKYYGKAVTYPRLTMLKRLQYTLIWISPQIYFKIINNVKMRKR